jgi:hypothetical protein
MLKLKSKPVEPQEEVEEEYEDEIEEAVKDIPPGINKTFQRKNEPEEVEEDNLKMTRLEILDAIDAHIIRVKQLLDIVRE